MSKKVLILTQNFYPAIGSAGNRMKNIFQLLTKQGIEVEVLTIEPSYPNQNMYRDQHFWDDEEINNNQDSITRVPIKSRNFSNKLLGRLFFYLEIMIRFISELWKRRKDEYDYIYVSTPPIFIVLSAWIGRILLKSKMVLEVRDLWPDSLTGVKSFDKKWILSLFRYLEKKMYQTADFIVINSKGFESHIQEKLKKQKEIIYLPNGARELELEKNQKNEEFRVIYAGNLGLAQDIERLKQTALQLNKHQIPFDVLGYGMKTKDFQNYIIENNLKNITIHSPTTRKKSLELIKRSQVSIAFLNDEQVFSTVLPGKVLDYMTCQTPIVAGLKGVAADLITNNQTGYISATKEVTPLVEKVVELRDNPDLLCQLQNNCLTTIKQQFLWENNIKKLADFINEEG